MRLLIQEAGKPVREFAAVAGLTIGRDLENTCAIDDDSASARHARLVLVNGQLAIEDLGSRNGTRITGGVKLGRGETVLLAHDLEIQLGNCWVRVVGASAGGDNATIRPGAASPADPDAARPRVEPARENATIRPLAPPPQDNVTIRPLAPPPQENATIRPGSPPAAREDRTSREGSAPREHSAVRAAPGADASDAPTLLPNRPAAPAPATSAPRPPPISKPASQAIPIPATIPKPADNPESVPKDQTAPDLDRTMGHDGSAMNPSAIAARLVALAPRLVFVVHKLGRSAPITQPNTRIGRRQVGSVSVAIEDEGVSSQHADLTFDGGHFWIEDVDSKNGTWVGEAKAASKPNKLEVKCDRRIRFGTIDVLFVRAAETGERPSPVEPYPEALMRLSKDPNVPQEKLREARTAFDSGRHPGELLILENAITVAQWCQAVDDALLSIRAGLSPAGRGTPGNKLTWILVASLVAAAVVIAVLLLR